MPTFRLQHLSSPELLRSVSADRLLLFLDEHRRYLLSRGVSLPPVGAPGEIDFETLAAVLLAPDARTPPELIEALALVDDLATPRGMDALLEEADRRGLDLGACADVAPADVALQVWLLDRDALARKHAELAMGKARTFESYQTDRDPVPSFRAPSEMQMRLLTRDLDDWFEKKKRGRGVRVFVAEREDGVYFQVRHGDAFKREERLDEQGASCVAFRPAKYDVVVYRPDLGELRVNARSEGEKDLYRQAFGRHVFGDPGFFPGDDKYTLEPLRVLGKAALECGDIEGVEWVRLVEVQTFHPGTPSERVTRQSKDFFALLEAQGRPFPPAGDLKRAKFHVQFAGAKAPRSVTVRPPNVAQFARDADAPRVEAWLAARGFLRGGDDGRQADALLAGA